ncbi:MAG TPA: hypothetical protein PK760_01470 [Flavobacteriales bacterium]|nr:hypothetical protein [Flavobacteriales bacterium]
MAASISAFAQPKTDKATVEWGPDLSEKETGEFGYVFGQSDDAVYMTMTHKRDMLVQKMNGSMTSLYSKPLDLELDKKDLSLEKIMLAGDKILVFAKRYDKKEDQNNLYMRIFDEANMNPTGGWDRIAQFDSKKAYAGGFNVFTSPNRKHILVTIDMPYEKDAPERFQLRVYDAEMQAEWDREITMPYDDKEFGLEEFKIDNKGDVIAIGVKYAERREAKALKRAGKQQYTYHIITFGADGSENDHAIDAKDKFLQDLTLSLDDGNGPILCGGLYGNKGAYKVRGAFFMSLDPKTKEIRHESYKEFTDDFITQYMTAKEEEKAKKKAARKDEELELYEYDLDEIVRREDGGAVLVGEQYYMYTQTVCSSTPNGGQTCRTIYHYIYNDMIVVNIDPQGNIEWASSIPKRQHTTNDGGFFSSYALAVKGTNLYLIYNDNGENLFLNAGDKFKYADFQGKNSIVTIATVDQDGGVKREALFDPEKRELILRPKSCRQLADDRLFMYATRKRDYKFGMTTFE